MDLAAALTELLKQGPIGAVAVTFIYLYLKKETEVKDLQVELRKESSARVADAVAVREVLLAIQERALTTATKMADMYEAAVKLLPPGGGR